MRITKYTKIIVALLMMTFIGQAVASTAMSCLNETSEPQIQEHLMDASAMDHTHMDMNSSSAMGSTDIHSNYDCHCGLGGCSAAAVPSAEQALSPSLSLQVKGYISLAVNQSPNPLYHPPE